MQTGYDKAAQITFIFGATRILCGTTDEPADAAQLVVKELPVAVLRAKLWWGLLLAAVLVAILVYNLLPSSADLGSGPLGPPGNHITQCLPGSLGHADTEGSQNFINDSHDTLVIDRVGLAAVRNLKVVGAYTVPGEGLVGSWLTFPPPADQLLKGVQWARRRTAAGTHVLPGKTINIVVGLEPTSPTTASTAGVEIFYHDGGTQYELISNLAVTIKVSPAKCF